MKKINVKKHFFLLGFLIGSITIGSAGFARADDFLFEGWNAENKEAALQVYQNTDWQSMTSLLNFGTKNSISKADVPDTYRESIEFSVDNFLKSDYLMQNFNNGLAGNTEPETYKELLIALSYILNNGDTPSEEENDIFAIRKYFGESITFSDRESSISYAYNRLLAAERAYNASPLHTKSWDIWKVDENFAVVIQGFLYGTGYTNQAEIYEQDLAKQWYEEHEDEYHFTSPNHKFAKKVNDIYSAVKVIGHQINYE